jgi:hypothetical protein
MQIGRSVITRSKQGHALLVRSLHQLAKRQRDLGTFARVHTAHVEADLLGAGLKMGSGYRREPAPQGATGGR